jgi:hypothetical protein
LIGFNDSSEFVLFDAANAETLSSVTLDGRPSLTILTDLKNDWIHSKGAMMGHDSSQFSPVFSIDVAAQTASSNQPTLDANTAVVALLRQLVMGQEKQNKLIDTLITATNAAVKQRNSELQQWRDANPYLANHCRRAAEALSRVQAAFLEQIAHEVEDTQDDMMDGEFVLSEFVDRFGPRLAHLNGVLQVLAQLGGNSPPQVQ